MTLGMVIHMTKAVWGWIKSIPDLYVDWLCGISTRSPQKAMAVLALTLMGLIIGIAMTMNFIIDKALHALPVIHVKTHQEAK